MMIHRTTGPEHESNSDLTTTSEWAFVVDAFAVESIKQLGYFSRSGGSMY